MDDIAALVTVKLPNLGMVDITDLVTYSLGSFEGGERTLLGWERRWTCKALTSSLEFVRRIRAATCCLTTSVFVLLMVDALLFGATGRLSIRVATCCPTTSMFVLLVVGVLPFGATGSLSAFLRVSMFLWFMGRAGMRLTWTCFYDDYAVLSRDDCTHNIAWGAECLLICL